MSDEYSGLDQKTIDLFRYIAGEAKHWDGTPPIEGLRPFSSEDKGRFTQLKKHGLLSVYEMDTDNHQINFTKAGIAFAKLHGIDLR